MHWLALRTNSSYITAAWTTDSVQGLVGCMLLTIVLGVTYEGLTYFIQYQEDKRQRLLGEKVGCWCVPVYRHCALAVLNTLRTLSICLLLLSVNTYNLWVLVSVVLGTGIGYLLLRPAILYFLRLTEKNPPQRGDIELQPLFDDHCVNDTTADKENMILGKYFGSIKNHLDYLKRKKIYNVQMEEEKAQDPTICPLLFTRKDAGIKDCHADQEYYADQSKRYNEDTSLSKFDSEERWKLVRDTFKRISKTRLQWRRQRGLPARIEQMGGLNDTFELEMDTWVQNESDVFHEKSKTLNSNKHVTMYVTVV